MMWIVYLAGMVKLKLLGDSSLKKSGYKEMFEETRKFVLQCYGVANCSNPHEARVEAWQKKMKRKCLEQPKLCALLPTEEAFQQNLLRAHLAAATIFDCHQPSAPTFLATDHGWYISEGHPCFLSVIMPEQTPMAPQALLTVTKCSSSSDAPCSSLICSCRKPKLSCTLFCHCK